MQFKHIAWTFLLGGGCLLNTGLRLAYGQNAGKDAPAVEKNVETESDDSMKEEYRKLEATLSNSTLTGQFTVDSSDSAPKPERYELRTVKKLPIGDLWLIQTRIKYGDHDVTVPLSLPIRWAGKTPVITVDNVTIPGLGTFNARVVISDGKYAGTWQHGDVGGHLFGKIEKSESSKEQPTPGENPESESKPKTEGN